VGRRTQSATGVLDFGAVPKSKCQTVNVNMNKPPNASGTYGFTGVIRHPSRILRPGRTNISNDDVNALEHGESRRVSCFLRGTQDGFPKRLRQGSLTLQPGQADWSPFWSIRREALLLDFIPSRIETRPADHREPNVKKGGKSLGVVVVPSFVVVTCMLESGNIDLVVPGVDEELVERFFRKRIQ
jgi:hypothetical protein